MLHKELAVAEDEMYHTLHDHATINESIVKDMADQEMVTHDTHHQLHVKWSRGNRFLDFYSSIFIVFLLLKKKRSRNRKG